MASETCSRRASEHDFHTSLVSFTWASALWTARSVHKDIHSCGRSAMAGAQFGRAEGGGGFRWWGRRLGSARYAKRRVPARPGVSRWVEKERYTVSSRSSRGASTRATAEFGRTMWRNAPFPVIGSPAGQDPEVRGPGRGRKWMDETDLPTQRPQARQDPWIPQADVDQGRSTGE